MSDAAELRENSDHITPEAARVLRTLMGAAPSCPDDEIERRLDAALHKLGAAGFQLVLTHDDGHARLILWGANGDSAAAWLLRRVYAVTDQLLSFLAEMGRPAESPREQSRWN